MNERKDKEEKIERERKITRLMIAAATDRRQEKRAELICCQKPTPGILSAAENAKKSRKWNLECKKE